MAETYKYFQPDGTLLRSAFGSGAILDNGDSGEIFPADLTERYICQQLGWPKTGTMYPFVRGVVSGDVWLRVSDSLYPSVAPHLTAAELATVTSTDPGFTKQSARTKGQPHWSKISVLGRGNSLMFGIGSSGTLKTSFLAQAIQLLDPAMEFEDDNGRAGEGDKYRYYNAAVGSSSWANTEGSYVDYPLPENLCYPQRIQTLALNDVSIFIYWLGTNDLAYDSTLSGADVWARAATRIAAFKSDFPDVPLIVCTTIRRSEDATRHAKIDAYNTLIRSNAASYGYVLCDFEADVPEVSLASGDTDDLTYYSGDGVHLTTAGQALLAPVAAAAIKEAEALL